MRGLHALACGFAALAVAGLAAVANAGPAPQNKECTPIVTRLATPGKVTLSGPKGFLLTKSATTKGTIVDADVACPDGATREGEVRLVVRQLDLGTVIFDQVINTDRGGNQLLFEQGSTFAVKHFVDFNSSACNGVPVAGSGVPTVGTLEYETIPTITEAGVDQGNTTSATKQIPVTCKPAK
ncbi:MAG: hypothetical protein JSU66_01910 [Deltaproteobacteria bacterium]|nr:MAG: hypothetical protein JSU66_01910 [Deltaproteobacteria bacterium]